MNLKGHDLDAECISVSFETGLLRFACHAGGDAPMELVIVNPQDPDYLPAMTWAITNGKL